MAKIEADRKLKVALDRFSATYQRRLAVDKLIDYWIALEALFSNSNTELSFKAPLRIARHLGRSIPERASLFELMRKSYDARSKIVHGAPAPREMAYLARETEQVLRRCLRGSLGAGTGPDIQALDLEAASAGPDAGG